MHLLGHRQILQQKQLCGRITNGTKVHRKGLRRVTNHQNHFRLAHYCNHFRCDHGFRYHLHRRVALGRYGQQKEVEKEEICRDT